jgi:hypothetical protein
MFALTFKANGIKPVLSGLTADEVRQQMEWVVRNYPTASGFQVTRASDNSVTPVRSLLDIPAFIASNAR